MGLMSREYLRDEASELWNEPTYGFPLFVSSILKPIAEGEIKQLDVRKMSLMTDVRQNKGSTKLSSVQGLRVGDSLLYNLSPDLEWSSRDKVKLLSALFGVEVTYGTDSKNVTVYPPNKDGVPITIDLKSFEGYGTGGVMAIPRIVGAVVLASVEENFWKSALERGVVIGTTYNDGKSVTVVAQAFSNDKGTLTAKPVNQLALDGWKQTDPPLVIVTG